MEFDVLLLPCFDEIHGCDGRTVSQKAGSIPRMVLLLNGVQLAVVLVRLVCDFVAVKTDVTDLAEGTRARFRSPCRGRHEAIGTRPLLPCVIMGVIQVSDRCSPPCQPPLRKALAARSP